MLVPAFLVRLDAAADYTTPYSFSTLSGLSSVGSSDGPGNVARFFGPSALAIDKANNLYVADEQNNLIRKITPAGVVSTVAGTAGVRGNTNGTGSAALFGNPQGIAIDSAGNLYVADKLNQMVRKITPDGVVTTLAGTTGIIGSGAPDGTPATAVLYILGGIAIDKADNIYVADWGLQVVRKITPAGAVSTFAGQVNVYGDTDGPGETASFLFPIGLTFDSAGSLWVTELGGAVRKISPEGVVSTVIPQSLGLQSVESIAFDPAGVPYLTDMKHVVRRRTAGGALEIFAGTEDVRGSADGTGTAASFSSPFGLAFDSNGNLFVADRNNNTIRKITPAGVVSTFAGLSPDNAGGSTDGALNAAKFESLGQVATGPNGDLYVADTVNFTIRKVARDGTVTTFAGKAGEPGNVDGTGAQARFEGPYGIAPATDGSLFVSDAVAHTIRKVTAQGAVTTLAGSADQPGATDGSGSAARFNNPAGLVVAADGSLFVADRDNHVIRKITSSGAVTTFAGIVGRRGALDGTLGNALFDTPEGLALDAAGNLYVSDSVRHGGIRRISPAGVVTTLAGGAGGEANAADGAGTLARFNEPGALAVNASGTVFVADMGNHAVRMISPAGIVSTTAGMAGAAGHADGTGAKSRFRSPSGLALDAQGALVLSSGTTLRKGLLARAPVITTQPANATATTGANVTLTAAADGTPAPALQWYFGAQAISGATSGTLTLTNVSPSSAGDYSVSATNDLGSVTSNKATVTVSALSSPPPSSPDPGGAGGGGGGAFSWWFVGMLLVLSSARWTQWRLAARGSIE